MCGLVIWSASTQEVWYYIGQFCGHYESLGPFVSTILGDYFVSFDSDTQVTGLINVVLIYLFYITQMILSELATYNPKQQFGNMYQKSLLSWNQVTRGDGYAKTCNQ